MTEHWAAYLCNVNDKLASIFLDINLRNTSPDVGRPWLLWVWVYFKQPRPDGLSSSEELATLCVIEDKLNDEIKEDCQAMFAGRITTQEEQSFTTTAPSLTRFNPPLQPWAHLTPMSSTRNSA
jgi:hypothetical protein